MLRVLTLVLTIVLLLMAAPASAIPICPSATMADYIRFGSTGCNLKNLTFLNFSYSGQFKIGLDIDAPSYFTGPPSEISVRPRNNPNLGAGGAALAFASPPSTHPFFGGLHWGFVDIGFEVFARTGPGIVRNVLSGDIASVANLQSGGIGYRAVPGGSLQIDQGVPCYGSGPEPPPSDFCTNPTHLSIPFTRFQEIAITGRNVVGIEAGFATPEPATLLLVGTGAAGVGLARWVKRRRSHAS